jgi:hypothetical protein
VVNDDGAATTAHVTVGDAARLGLVAASTYAVSDVLSGTTPATRTGADLANSGLDVALAPLGTAVVLLAPQ